MTGAPRVAALIGALAALVAVAPGASAWTTSSLDLGTTESERIVIDSDGSHALVASMNSLKYVQLGTFSLDGTAGLVESPSSTSPFGVAIAPGGTSAYVVTSNAGIRTVPLSPLAPADGSGTGTLTPIGGGFPAAIAIDPGGTYAYVTVDISGTNGRVDKVRLSDGAVVASYGVGRHPLSIAIDPAGHFAYVGNRISDTITRISLSGGTITTLTLGLLEGAIRDLAISPDGARLYAAGELGRLTVVDLATFAVLQTITISNDGSWGLSLDPDGAFLTVVNANTSDTTVRSISRVRTSDMSVVATVGLTSDVSRPRFVAIDPDARTAYVTSFSTTKLARVILGSAAPTGLSGTPSTTSASIAFSAPAAADAGSPTTNYSYSLGGGAWTPLATPDATSPITIPGLAPGTTYSVRIRAENGVARGLPSSPLSVTTTTVAPGAPSGPTATVLSTSAIRVSWTAPASDGGAPITAYTASTTSGASCTATSTAPATPATTCDITGLTPATTYTISVTATNSAGTGTASATTSATTSAAPAAPADGGAPATSGSTAPTGSSTTAGLAVTVRRVTGSTIVSTFTASGPGTATQTGTVVTATRAGRAQAVRACSTTTRVRKAGTVTLTCRLTRQARALRRKGALRVRLVTAFTPTGGTKATGARTVTLSRAR